MLYINGNNIITDIMINDGHWHFLCIAWTSQNGLYEIHLDGKLHDTGYNLSSNSAIEGDGALIIGQEQVNHGSQAVCRFNR